MNIEVKLACFIKSWEKQKLSALSSDNGFTLNYLFSLYLSLWQPIRSVGKKIRWHIIICRMITAYMGIKPVTLTLIVLFSLKKISRLYIKILNLHDHKDYQKL